jgi:hypothetical protein
MALIGKAAEAGKSIRHNGPPRNKQGLPPTGGGKPSERID